MFGKIMKTRPRLEQFLLTMGLLPSAAGQEVIPKVVGGTAAGAQEYPFFSRWGGCGATLIHNDIGLSAAHVSDFDR